jgi:hypothetical protein
MRPGWNPTRRNRNIGTKAQGHGANNRFVIPEARHEAKCYYEKLSSFVSVVKTIGERHMQFFIEPTRPDFFYPCSLDDMCTMLAHCSNEEFFAFDFIVLRQPTRKQRILCPVRGRAIFHFDIDKVVGAAIVIEAQDLLPIKWPVSIDAEKARELDRLRQDGHVVYNTRRGIEIRGTPDVLRNTVLYRTFLHEIGHHVDFRRSSSTEGAWDGKTRKEKEDFAHRYALALYERLSKLLALPFAAIINDESLASENLKRHWFCLPSDDSA